MLIAHPCPSGILPENHPFLVHCTSYASMQGHWQGCLLSLSLSPSLPLTLTLPHSLPPSLPSVSLTLTLTLILPTLSICTRFIHMPDHATIIAPFFVPNARPPRDAVPPVSKSRYRHRIAPMEWLAGGLAVW